MSNIEKSVLGYGEATYPRFLKVSYKVCVQCVLTTCNNREYVISRIEWVGADFSTVLGELIAHQIGCVRLGGTSVSFYG